MAANDVKLLGGWPSLFVMRVRMALEIKAVDYEFLEEKIGSNKDFLHKSELLLKSNPVYKKIPVLIHGDKPISESLVIVQYIDEWVPSLSAIGMAESEEAKKAAMEQVEGGLVLLENAFVKCSKGKNFFSGDQVGYLDITLGCFLGWLRVTEKMNNVKLLDEAKTPGLDKWADRFCSDVAVKDVMPETEKLIEFAKVVFAKLRAASPN
ncbi:hypothetical protein F0562_033715 [Nyssa sinensis]|uniref:Glutathione S-transferase n=1 Tax=Nyssa sinensis TaxID=561372 RepID=A0A5J5AI86_9ASTE|nr:hypothetical protein F0562_033715 [Nyssa sinensis]